MAGREVVERVLGYRLGRGRGIYVYLRYNIHKEYEIREGAQWIKFVSRSP